MTDIASLSGSRGPNRPSGLAGVSGPAGVVARAGVAGVQGATGASAPRRVDRAEFSAAAQMIGRLHDVPIREDLVGRVRVQIQNNTYESPDKVEKALDEIGKDLSYVIERTRTR